MAKLALRTPAFVGRLRDALLTELRTAGISAKIQFERIPATKLFRFLVVAKEFKPMWHTERQSLVWRIVDRTLSHDEDLLVAGIMTLTPDELGDVPSDVRGGRRARRAG